MNSAPFAPITIDEALQAGHALLVPNPRLVRILKQRLALWREPGARVLRTPPVFTLGDWLDRQLEEWRLLGLWKTTLPERLDEAAERALWERAVADCEPGDVLLDTDAAAQLAMETWQLVMQWAIPLDKPGLDEEEWLRFRHWLVRFRGLCERHGCADRHVWLQQFMQALRRETLPMPSAPLVLVGFVEFTAMESELLSVLGNSGCTLLEAALPQQESQASRVSCASPDAEWLAAASWAQRYLAEHPGAQVAILVNELGQAQARVAQTLDAVFHPAALLHPQMDIERRYNIALGTPLAHYPLVNAVMHWLRWLGQGEQPLPREWISSALLMPFCRGSESEYTARARFDAWLRRQGHARLSLPALRECLDAWTHKTSGQAPELAAMLDALLAIGHSRHAGTQVNALLQALGWPGERPLLLSEQRTANAFYRQLEAFDDMARWLPAGLGAQLRWFRRSLRETLHQPSGSDNAPVQVMGLLDAVGRRFDAVWVANLTAGNWPAQPRPNPLIPQVWQHDIPHANSARERDYARHLMAQLSGLAGTVIFSHAERDGDQEAEPSPLIAGIPLAEASLPDPAGLVGRMRETGHIPDNPWQHPWLQWQEDIYGKPIAESERAHVRGGTGLFRSQAFCPFAGWARRALDVRPLDVPDDDLDASERGSLVHQALEIFWRQVQDQSTLLGMTPAQELQAITQAIEQAMQSFEARYRPLPERYRNLESQRMQRWLQQWLLHERRRAPFVVAECEQEKELQFAGFRIRTVIDRIDRMPDGSLLVIDYKTGTVSAERWLGERLLDPQLPLYAQSGGAIAGTLFARVRSDDMGWCGVIAQRNWIPLEGKATQPAALQGWAEGKAEKSGFADFADWAALSSFWQQRLETLADEIAAGYAEPVLFDEKAVPYCEVRLLMRLPEIAWQRRSWLENAR